MAQAPVGRTSARTGSTGSDGRPLYRQIRDFLRGRIASGQFAVGSTLPTEAVLQSTFGVSRATVRSAIRELVAEGTVRPTPGVGTVVIRSRPPVLPSLLRGFTEDLVLRGIPTEARVISARMVPPPPLVRDRLETLPGEEVLHLVRLRLMAGSALALMNNYVPASIGIGPDEDFSGPLYQLIERSHRHFITHGRDAIGARAARPEDAAALEVEVGTPVLVLKRTAYIAHDRPVEYVEAVIRTDLYEYNVTLLRGKDRT